jgi:elongation factor Ts
MAEFTPKDVAALRKQTSAGILDCREALQVTDGNVEDAAQWLREKGKVSAGKRADRERREGAVAVVVHGADSPTGAVVALECETDFVAKSAEFVSLVEEIAESVASKGDEALAGYTGSIEQLAMVSKENVALGRTAYFAGGEGSVISSYLHLQAGRGVNAVLVELTGGSEELAHDIAVHVAFARPEFLRREDVPAEVVERERQTAAAIARNEGKPEAALDKIVEGRLQGWFKDRCLLDQAYVRDEKQTVAQHLGTAELVRFAQVVVGS